MFDFRQACDTMIRQQLRTTGVLNDEVLAVIREIPREIFVPEAYQAVAYADMSIPLAHAQEMWRPEAEAQVLQALALTPTDQVLEVGTGSGYFTALLAHMAGHVTSVDVFQTFVDAAQRNPWFQKRANIDWLCQDFSQGPQNVDATYDVIVISGALYALPQAYLTALRPGGRLVAVLGTPTVMETLLIEKGQQGALQTHLFETLTPYLVNATPLATFKF